MFKLPKNFKRDLILLNDLFENEFDISDDQEDQERVSLEVGSVSFKRVIILYNRLYNFYFSFYFKYLLTEKELNSESFAQFQENLSTRTHEEMLTFDSKNFKHTDGSYHLNKIWNYFRSTQQNYYLVQKIRDRKRSVNKYNTEFSSCKNLTESGLRQTLNGFRLVYLYHLLLLVEYVFARQELFKILKKLNQSSLVFGFLEIIFALDEETMDYMFLLLEFLSKYVSTSKYKFSKSHEKN